MDEVESTSESDIHKSFAEAKEGESLWEKTKNLLRKSFLLLLRILRYIIEVILWRVIALAITAGLSYFGLAEWNEIGNFLTSSDKEDTFQLNNDGQTILNNEPSDNSTILVKKPLKGLNKKIRKWKTISFDELKAKAEKSNKRAQYELGLLYFTGDYYRATRNLPMAVDWWEKSAVQGYAAAQNALGFVHWEGEGMEKDRVEAVKWYEQAVEKNFRLAQYNLGVAYWKGEGVAKKDFAEAVRLWRLAAKQGLPEAQYDLAEALWLGDGVEKKSAEGVREQAVTWYKKAAKQGYGTASVYYRLGLTYIESEDLELNDSDAYYWLSLAIKVAQEEKSIADSIATINKTEYEDALRKISEIEERLNTKAIATVTKDVDALETKFVKVRENKKQTQLLVVR